MSDRDAKPVEAVEVPTESIKTEATTEAIEVEGTTEAPVTEEKAEATAVENKETETETKKSAHQAPEGMLRVSGPKAADDKVFRNNVKFDPSVLPETDDPKQIRTQVLFTHACHFVGLQLC